MRRRTLGRELALKLLYQIDLVRLPESEHEPFLENSTDDRDARTFALSLVRGIRDHGAELDSALTAAATNWDLDRMATIDRNILRIGAFELLYGNDAPPKVVINEGVELGKRFSGREAGAFVNGILDKLYDRTPTDSSEPGETA